MLKKVLTYCLIIFGLAVLYLSTSKDMMQKISDARNDHDEWWGSHFAYEGDLVGMSYLYYVKDFHKPRQRVFAPRNCDNGKAVNLVLWGDSYTMHFRDTDFCADRFQYGRCFWSSLDYEIDSTKKNVLIIECTERVVRNYFANNRMANEVKRKVVKSEITLNVHQNIGIKHAGITMPDVTAIFNDNINQNIEYNLFSYNFVSPVRKLKALMTYKVFNRASGNVVVADKGDRIFLKETTSDKLKEGYATPVSQNEIDKLVEVFNDLNNRYKAAGFDQIYLSIIPNAVTIYQPEGYNMLIPRIQNHKALKMKVIDVYTPFMQKPDGMFWKGDTHWSNAGADVWLKIVNKVISGTTAI